MEKRGSQQLSGDHQPQQIPEPEPAHITGPEDEDSEREATELRTTTRPGPPRRILTPGTPSRSWYDPLRKFWRHHVRVSVPHVDCRDHLANERTFLGYLRTSVALSMMGIIIAQLWRLQHSLTPDPVFGYYAVSKPLSAILQFSALGVILVGTARYFKQQSLMTKGKIQAGGWEVFVIMGGVGMLLLTLFVVQIGIEIWKDVK